MTDPSRHRPKCDCGIDHVVLIVDRFTITQDGCWQWTGPTNINGYGFVSHRSASWPAHRMSYWAYRGDFQRELQIDHLCKNRGCVNPDHLEPVTRRENILRSSSPSALNARRELCERGHRLTASPRPQQARRCVICEIDKRREWVERNPPLEANDHRHGTLYAYQSFKCRCVACVAEVKRRTALRSTAFPRLIPEHGTRNRYRSGCKCVACRAANAAHVREIRARKSNQSRADR